MTRPKLPVRAIGRRLTSLLAVLSLVAMLTPAHVAAAGPDTGYDVSWTVTGPDGLPRTDNGIAVGDDLQLTYAAVDGTAVTSCGIRLSTVGGGLMQSPSRMVDGVCTLTIRLPDFPDPVGRAAEPTDSSALDLCVVAYLGFADGQPRGMTADDQKQPGGRLCSDSNVLSWPEVLDIPIVPGGTPRAFASDPQVLSWNPADWGTGMTPLTFGQSWHYEAPAWLETCAPYLLGAWTIVRPERQLDCQQWDVRLPGVLPSNLPWSGFGTDGSWSFELVSEYTANQNVSFAQTISEMRTPMAPSDTVFESSLPAIFPVDLATARFLTKGQPWRPVFQFSGGSVSTCTMTVGTWVLNEDESLPGDRHLVEDRYEVATSSDERCTFDVPAFGTEEEQHGYDVSAGDAGGISYVGNLFEIPAPEPPIIDPPTEGENGDTTIGVAPGDGQGLGLELKVTADPTLTMTRAVRTADAVLCQDAVLSTDLAAGGAIPNMDTDCALAPGRYLATARMVDAAGVVTLSTRTFTVLGDPPRVIRHTPASGAASVERDATPTVTFDMAVAGISAATVRLQDVGSGAYVSATVTYDAVRHRATVLPVELLRAGRTYRLHVTNGITNAGGHPLVAKSWTFKVSTDATRPTFVPTPPRSATGIGRGANVFLLFSEPVRGVSGSTIRLRDPATGLYVGAIVTYDEARHRAVLNPTSTLRSSRRYVVVIGTGITDQAGNPLAGASWSFTTRP